MAVLLCVLWDLDIFEPAFPEALPFLFMCIEILPILLLRSSSNTNSFGLHLLPSTPKLFCEFKPILLKIYHYILFLSLSQLSMYIIILSFLLDHKQDPLKSRIDF